MLPSILLLASIAPYTYAFSIPPLPHLRFLGATDAQKQQQPLHDSLDAWIQQEERTALDKLLANVSPGGRNVEGKGVAPGTVVASPSQDGPDYWYQCGWKAIARLHDRTNMKQGFEMLRLQ
jgi:glucoamylase